MLTLKNIHYSGLCQLFLIYVAGSTKCVTFTCQHHENDPNVAAWARKYV